MKETFCFKVAIETCTANTLVLISDSDQRDIFGRLQRFRANIFCDSSACAKKGNNGKWHRLHVSRPFQSIVGAAAPVGPQFYQWTITFFWCTTILSVDFYGFGARLPFSGSQRLDIKLEGGCICQEKAVFLHSLSSK